MPADPNRVRDVFLAAIELPLDLRPAYLADACQANADLRAEVDRLLVAHADPDSILEPAFPAATEATAELAASYKQTVDLPRMTSATTALDADAPQPTQPASAARGSVGATGMIDSPDPNATTAAASASSPQSATKASTAEGIGTTIAGRYSLVEVIGEGGMGSVYLASQTEPVKRQVALKLIKSGMDSRSVLARFDAERQALALMDHPNIARIYDGGLTPAGKPFFVMELVRGVPLTDYCDQKRLSVKQRLDLFVAVCHAVQHAHQKGIIHRDLKPGNVLVAEVDGRPTPKVIDFGVAKATEIKLTDMSFADAGAIVGTPTYMSPEQADPMAMDIDTRTDVYALGVILYELLVGSPPLETKDFRRGAILEMLRMVREVEPPRPSTKLSKAEALPNIAANRGIEPASLAKLLHGELDWVVMKAMEKDRTRRYETANGFARDIQRYLADEVVEARPPSAGYRLKKFVRRNKASMIAASAVAASLLIGLFAFAWQARVARDQRDLAIKAEKAEAEQRKIADTARNETELALTESQGKTARMTYERAQALCESGQADVGLLWMARSLELTPAGALDLDYAIRTSINLWGQQLNTVKDQWLIKLGGDWQGSMWGPGALDIALSPDGLSVLLVDIHGTARVFEQSAPKIRFVLPLEPDAPVAGKFLDGSRFSPDGRFLALARSDNRARVWSAVNGQLVGKPLAHEEPLTGVGFDPTGKLLVTTAGTKIHFWNVETGAEEGEPITTEQGLSGAEVNADGRHLMTWSRSPGSVVVWDFKSRKRVHSLVGVDFEVYHASFSPDGRLIVASGSSNPDTLLQPMVAQFWETATGRPVGVRMNWRPNMTSGEPFNRPCFRPDGRLLVTGGTPLRMWQVPSGKPLGAVASMLEAQRPVFLPDGKILVAFFNNSASINKQLIDLAPALEPVALGARFGDGYRDSLAFAPDGRTMVRSYFDPEKQRLFCRLYELPAGTAVGEFIETDGYDVDKGWWLVPSFNSDGRSVATVIGTNICQILDTATGRERIPRWVTGSRIRALAFSPDGNLLASGDSDGAVRLWNTATGKSVGPSMVNQQPINRIRFSPDGRKLLVVGGDAQRINGEARLWDVATGQPLGPGLAISGSVRAAAFSPDGKSFATGSFQLVLWDTATCRQIWTAPSKSLTEQLAFTPDGRRVLATHFEENAARLYDTRTGEPVTPLLRHQGEIVSTALSHDGRLVLTSSLDHTTRLWDTALGLPLGPGWSSVEGGNIAFSPDGRGFLMIDDTHNLVRWDLPAPIEGTPERIRLGIEAATRSSLDPFGAIEPLSPILELDPVTKRSKLSADPFEPVGKRLHELGGPTGTFRR
jgi:WD40 repeat protein/serine/threonine protein kinase